MQDKELEPGLENSTSPTLLYELQTLSQESFDSKNFLLLFIECKYAPDTTLRISKLYHRGYLNGNAKCQLHLFGYWNTGAASAKSMEGNVHFSWDISLLNCLVCHEKSPIWLKCMDYVAELNPLPRKK